MNQEKKPRKPKDPKCRWHAYQAKPHAQIMAEKTTRDAQFDEDRSKMMKEVWQARRNRAGDTQNA